jgi:hypothetical protein
MAAVESRVLFLDHLDLAIPLGPEQRVLKEATVPRQGAAIAGAPVDGECIMARPEIRGRECSR